MKWLIPILLPIALFGTSGKVVVFDYGGVLADANYEPLTNFLSQTIDVPNLTSKSGEPHPHFKEDLNKPASFWIARADRPLSKNWVTQFEKKQKHLHLPIAGMKEIIEELKDSDVPIAILSNTSHARATLLKSQGAYASFEPVLLSCNLGVRKPHKHAYQILLKTLKIAPENCLFIDDKLRNIRAARELGIDAIHFRSAKELRKELLKREIFLTSFK